VRACVLGLKLDRFAVHLRRPGMRFGLAFMRLRRLRISSHLCPAMSGPFVRQRPSLPLAGTLGPSPGFAGLI